MSSKVYHNDFKGYMFLGSNRYTYNEPLDSHGFGLQELTTLKHWFPLFNTDYANIAIKTAPHTGIIRQSRLSAALNPEGTNE